MKNKQEIVANIINKINEEYVVDAAEIIPVPINLTRNDSVSVNFLTKKPKRNKLVAN